MARMHFEQSGNSLSVIIRRSPASMVLYALALVAMLTMAVVMTFAVVSVVRERGGIPPVGGFVVMAAWVLALWIGVASVVWTLGISHVVVLDRNHLSVVRRWASFAARPRESVLDDGARLTVPPLPPFLSWSGTPSDTLVLADGTAVGIDRNVVGRRDASRLAARLNDYLGGMSARRVCCRTSAST